MKESEKAILKERSKKLAQVVNENQNKGFCIDIVQFTLGKEIYAFESKFIKEVYPLKNVVSLPSVPHFILGIINVRRKIYSLVDLRVLFDLPISSIEGAKAILLEYEGAEFAVLAEKVIGASSILIADLQIALPTMVGIRQDYLKGITLNGITVLDGYKLLTDHKLSVGSTLNNE